MKHTARLDILMPDGKRRCLHLAGKRTYSIGRAAGNDIQLADAAVSRRHALIQVEENGTHSIIDLGSANGTLVNERRIVTPHPLANNDRITIGATELRFQHSGPAAGHAGPGQETAADDQTIAAFSTVQVAVLVSDIHDFTPLAERLGPERAGELLQQWSRGVERIVASLDGTVDIFLGDGVLAWWPEANNGPGEAVRQALAAACAIERMTASLSLPGVRTGTLGTAAAVNAGQAVAGSITGRQRFTVIGDAVNVAFRLEEATDQTGDDILVGEAAARLAGAVSPWFARRTCRLKGKVAPVTAAGTTFSQVARFLEHGKGR